MPGEWLVVRQDDNGNVYVLAECETEPEARAIASTYEARGHKQMYSVVRRERVSEPKR